MSIFNNLHLRQVIATSCCIQIDAKGGPHVLWIIFWRFVIENSQKVNPQFDLLYKAKFLWWKKRFYEVYIGDNWSHIISIDI